eukprot:7009147-Alexandrium_andersonii.AAC.1
MLRGQPGNSIAANERNTFDHARTRVMAIILEDMAVGEDSVLAAVFGKGSTSSSSNNNSGTDSSGSSNVLVDKASLKAMFSTAAQFVSACFEEVPTLDCDMGDSMCWATCWCNIVAKAQTLHKQSYTPKTQSEWNRLEVTFFTQAGRMNIQQLRAALE